MTLKLNFTRSSRKYDLQPPQLVLHFRIKKKNLFLIFFSISFLITSQTVWKFQGKPKLKKILEKIVGVKYLATERAKAKWVKEAALADLTCVGDTFARPWLRAFVQEHNPGTVDNVGLDSCNVQNFLNLRDPNHIMVWGPPYLSPKKEETH